MTSRCLLCTTNDREALIEQVARDMWAAQKWDLDLRSWDEVEGYWQHVFRAFASVTIDRLGGDH